MRFFAHTIGAAIFAVLFFADPTHAADGCMSWEKKCPGSPTCVAYDSVCCSGGLVAPEGSTCCKDGTSCPKEHLCSPNGCVKRPAQPTVPMPIPRNREPKAEARGAPPNALEKKKVPSISSTCLTVGVPEVVAFDCKKLDGTKAVWQFTWVTSTEAQGCPKEINFSFVDPNIDGIRLWGTTPQKITVCGDVPKDPQIRE